jgi:WD40 repeat protein
VTVDAGSPLAVPTNGSASIPDLAAGAHTVTLAGLADNCALTTPAPLEVTVPGAAGAVANMEITCTVIYTLAYRGESGLELTDAAGTVHRTFVLGGDPLAWSPDGLSLAVTSFVDGVTRVWITSPDDGGRKLLSAPGEQVSSDHYVGVWSPDGRELLLETVFRSHTTSLGLARYPLDESYLPQSVFAVSWEFFGVGVPRELGVRGYTWLVTGRQPDRVSRPAADVHPQPRRGNPASPGRWRTPGVVAGRLHRSLCPAGFRSR